MIGAASALRLFLGAWALLLFSLFIAAITAVAVSQLASWLPASALATCIGAIVVVIAVRMGGGAFLPLSLGRAVAASIIVGCIVGVSQVLVSLAFGWQTLWHPGLVIASATLTIGLVGTCAVLFAQAFAEQVSRRSRLLTDSLLINESREDVAEIAIQMRQMLAQDIDVALTPARVSIEERLRDQADVLEDEDWTEAARELRAAASETVGPLSRQLWAPDVPGEPGLTLWSVIRNVVTKQPFQPLALALLVLVTFFAGLIDALGWIAGLSTLLVGSALVWSILTLANAVMRRWPNHHAAIYLGTIVVLEAGHLLPFAARTWLGGTPQSLLEFVVAAIMGVVLAFLTSAFGSLRDYREGAERAVVIQADRELAATITASRQVAQLARESARVLHGTVQTRLIACAVAIERASQTRDVEAFRAALREAHEVLAQTSFAEDVGYTTLESEVDRKVRLWSGLCDITVHVDPDLAAISGRPARDVGRVVEEGLSNAIRHGGADLIAIHISGSNEGIRIEIRDNGSGPAEGPPGLGSALLDSVSSSWMLRARTTLPPAPADGSAGGAHLLVTLPS